MQKDFEELKQKQIKETMARVSSSREEALKWLQEMVDTCKWLCNAPELENSDRQGLLDAATLLEQQIKKPVIDAAAIENKVKLILLVMESIGWDKPPQQ